MTFKPLNENDIANTRTLLHEAVPLTGTIISGTYGTFHQENNIKNYSHGMLQSVYDYPYLSSSANHIFDITIGLSSGGALQPLCTTAASQASKKKNIYNQMSQVLMGYDATGSIQPFDEDGDIIGGGTKIRDAIVVPMARLLSKDEIKKETFELKLGISGSTSGYNDPFGVLMTITDVSASTEYRVNSPVGEYGILYATSSTGKDYLNQDSVHTASFNNNKYWYAGLLFYQAGVMVLTSSVFKQQLNETAGGIADGTQGLIWGLNSEGALSDIVAGLTGSQISSSADYFRHRIYNMQFNNTTELNSTIYFCRANHNEFNYSSNPTYLSNSKIRVKTIASDNPVAYITTVGLYNDNNELLATAKLSEPLKKSPATEFTIRARLDY
jgi:hypothetical protein